MRNIILSVVTVAALAALPSFANAQEAAQGAATGAAVGAGTGFLVGGPVGAAVGAGVGGTVGASAGEQAHRDRNTVVIEHNAPVREKSCVTDGRGDRTCTEVVR
jgi:hypothetical protein